MKKFSQTLAKIVRTISIPPLMVLAMLVIVFFTNDAVFAGSWLNLLLAILFLALIPIAAYPAQPLIPKYKKRGREGQRDLALLFTPIGYTGAVVYGLIAHISDGLLVIYLSYFLSVGVLLFFNKIIKFRASGHMCSITGPLMLFVYFVGWKALAPSALLWGLICWASLTLKRHTLPEVIGGCASCGIGFALGLLIVALV